MSEELLSLGNTKYLINSDFLSEFDLSEIEALFDRTSIESQKNVEKASGRGKTLLFSAKDKNLVLRQYRRGGFFGKFVKHTFYAFDSFQHRAFDEFRMLSKMVDMGLPVPTPAVAREIKTTFGIRQDIVIQRISGFKDLSYLIKERSLTDEELVSIGKTIKKFFDNNILHTDLNIRNILLNEDSSVYIIDFDKCFIKPMKKEDKEKIVNRLLRSFIKEKTKKSAYFEEEKFELLKKEALS